MPIRKHLFQIFFPMILVAIGLILSVEISPTVLYAASLPPQELDRLVHSADAIVVATVAQVQSQKETRFVTTDTFLKVETVLKGSVGSTIQLHQRGGRVGNFATIVPGMPYYSKGERVLIFLEAKPNQRFVTASLWLGKYEIHHEHGKDYVFVSSSLLPKKIISKAPVTHATTDSSPSVKDPQQTHEESDSQKIRLPLQQFIDEIARSLQKHGTSA